MEKPQDVPAATSLSSLNSESSAVVEEQPVVSTSHRNNNFNFLRLVLAVLVILSHSFELIPGQRELLTRVFHTITLGGVAVNGFFLLSGYLIVQSWERSPHLGTFLKKRILRIYPGFLVASCVCAFVVGPLGSHPAAYFAQFHLLQFLKEAVLLHPPAVPPVFEGQSYPVVNGAMWTIAYEFRCYLCVALLGMCGLFKRRQLWLALTILTMMLFLAPTLLGKLSFPGLKILIANPKLFVSFFMFFSVGGCFFLFRDRIPYRRNWAAVALLILLPCMFRLNTAQIALSIAGGYLLFSAAFARSSVLDRFKTTHDISYGVYLYGWPVQKLLLWYLPALAPGLLFLLACGGSGLCGLLSWQLVEQPFLRMKARIE